MIDDFDKNVFVNCPFDDDYRKFLLSIIFTVRHFGLNPRLALEREDSGESRITKILEIIAESKFGIHDLSRTFLTKKDEFCRMNMPFELGIDFGCQKLSSGKFSSKKILILEAQRYRFQKSISDISGSDIKNHDNDEKKLVGAVRDWLVNIEFKTGSGTEKILSDYIMFKTYLYDEIVEKEGHGSIDNIPIPEIAHHISNWLENTK